MVSSFLIILRRKDILLSMQMLLTARRLYQQAFQAKIRLHAQKSLRLFKSALKQTEFFLRSHPREKEALLLKARILNGLGQKHVPFYLKALKCCDDAIALDKKCAEAYALRGEIRIEYQSKKAYSDIEHIYKALQDLNEAIRLDERQGMAYAWRADARHHLGLPPGAEDLRDLTRAARLCPKNAWVVGRLGVVQYGLQLWDEAYSSLSRAIRLNPKLDWAYAWRSEIIRRRGGDLSGKELQRGLSDPLTRIRLALRLLEKKEYRKALAELHVLARHPKNEYPVIYRLLELAQRELGELRKAVESLNALAALDPSMAEWNPACLYEDSLRLPLPPLEELLRSRPLYAQAHAWQGRQEMAAGRADRALSEFSFALALDSQCSWAYFWRAEFFYLSGNPERSFRDIQQALKIQPQHLSALSLLGQIYLSQGLAQKAAGAFSRYLRWRAVDPEPYVGRARAYMAMGKTQMAKRDLKHSLLLRQVRPQISSDPGKKSPLDYSGHLFREAGQKLPSGILQDIQNVRVISAAGNPERSLV